MQGRELMENLLDLAAALIIIFGAVGLYAKKIKKD